MEDILYFLGLLIPELNEALKTIGVVTLLFGLANAFFGYKLFRAMLSLLGFLAGGVAGGVVFIRTQSIFSDREMFWIYVIIGGFIGAGLIELFHHLGVFLATGAMGALTGLLLTQSTDGALIIGIIVGILSVIFEKYVIIISTAISGARLAALGIQFMRLAEGEYREASAMGWLIAICGMTVQFLIEFAAARQMPEKAVSEEGETGGAVRITMGEAAGIGQSAAYAAQPRTESVFRCPNCGAPLSPETKFCGKCGFNVKESTVKGNLVPEGTVKESMASEDPAKGNNAAENSMAGNNTAASNAAGDSTVGEGIDARNEAMANNEAENNAAGNNTAGSNAAGTITAGNGITGSKITESKVNGNSMGTKSPGKNVYCGKCGTKLPEHARFCPKCGAAQN